ncbi:TPA: hypothetical protein N0F65_003739 [Lagenidium giganteum]|uniref:Integrase catalytic domain-containing protein n=1 Tax=Lagenidium giganteum TaxID=4803 RepID=A0AAV2YYE9_9STRA|nr:TPA: hypothetical protein N0F65_003739 [Lagenidium giganteum]
MGGRLISPSTAAIYDVVFCVALMRSDSLMKWHLRFAHLHFQALRDLVRSGILSHVDADTNESCVVCSMMKSRWMSYKSTGTTRVARKGEKLMADVCYVGIKSAGGARLFLLVQDEATRYKWGTPLLHKGEAFGEVRCIIDHLIAEGYHVKQFASDQGAEFRNSRAREYLTSKGITQLFTNTYPPEENCLVEKSNGTILAKAFGYAVAVENVCPSRALVGITPFHAFHAQQPQVQMLHVWGCVAYIVPKVLRTNKLAAIRQPHLFMGIAKQQPGFRLLDLITGHVHEKRDVLFDESLTVKHDYVDQLLRKTAKSTLTPARSRSGSEGEVRPVKRVRFCLPEPEPEPDLTQTSAVGERHP